MTAELVQISLSVPYDRVAEVYTYVAGLIDGHAAAGTSQVPSAAEKAKRSANGFGRATVRRNYFGGQSDYWRPFLNALADKPDDWVAWRELCKSIGLTPREASGMLGAAERRCKGYPPYYKSGYSKGDHWFSMPTEVAAMIKEFSAEK